MKVDNSLELLSKAEKIIPLATQTFSKSSSYYPKGVAPVYLKRGWGSHVWDIDENEYIDFVLGLGPITLGYCYPRVNDAVMTQLLDSGSIFSLPHPLEVEMAELITEIVPSAEMVRFLKTGSEACQAAIRAARAYTNRVHIAYRGYHGWHDWYAVTTERNRGISKVLEYYMHGFKYNDIKSLEEIFKNNVIAAVIMEPMIVEEPRNGFLQQVRELCTQNGVVLIFDETVTGFRWSLGGAQEYFGVTPDLTVFGKGIANGFPLSVVCGKKEVMREFEDVFVSSTFGGDCISLAAGIATVKEMRDKKTIEHCWKMGQRLMDGLNGLEIKTNGYPCRPAIVRPFSSKAKTLFAQEVIKRGILLQVGLLNLCYSHTENDIENTIEACGEAIEIVNRAEESDDWSMLEGEIIQPSFRRL